MEQSYICPIFCSISNSYNKNVSKTFFWKKYIYEHHMLNCMLHILVWSRRYSSGGEKKSPNKMSFPGFHLITLFSYHFSLNHFHLKWLSSKFRNVYLLKTELKLKKTILHDKKHLHKFSIVCQLHQTLWQPLGLT